ncbi:MAG: hypothetical protein LBC87_03980 [Fibromonadaceae bacterium]|jgi:hypothetical protein|nr:hypothetical protein [Fibromonadaceae bacterium]
MKCSKCGRHATHRHNSKFLCSYCYKVERFREEHGKLPSLDDIKSL